MELLYEITLETGAFYEAYADEKLHLKEDDCCIIKKDKILDYGKIKKYIGSLSPELDKRELPFIERKATMRDKSKANENRVRAKSAYKTALSHIKRLGLKMKLLNAHYSFDKKLATFQFTANGRVDFRQLVKDLSQSLNTRIELRQIGVRDETSILGGLGVCGYELCCKRYIKKFDSINVKMAKEQDLSLNPVNISGICGRLKCCLKYEHDGYLELDKDMPRRGAFCECEEGIGRITDRNLLTQQVTVTIEESSKCITCPKKEVRVIYPDKYKVSGVGSNVPETVGEDEEIPEEVFELDDSEEIKKMHGK
ncbi:MAG: stage 0 sporulation protein [Victivallales bacterium]|nr:stage 0 sporulation protein [Victivallales bacterium]MCF7888852.1 stage 0 sporulation protein [Victivallales bacterium]